MLLNEEKMREIDDRIPELARRAVAEAVERAKKSRQSVVVTVGRQIVRVYPSGTQEIIKELPAKVPVRPGKRRIVR